MHKLCIIIKYKFRVVFFETGHNYTLDFIFIHIYNEIYYYLGVDER